MLAAERQSRIVDVIRKKGSVHVDELAKELSVSPMTIRRDLVKLQQDDRIERCHGGAMAKQEVTYEDKLTSHKKKREDCKMLLFVCLRRRYGFWMRGHDL